MGPGPVLLIWEEVPESMKMFWLDKLTQAEFEHIVAAHGTFINSDDENEHTRWVMDFLYDKESGDLKHSTLFQDELSKTKPVEIERECTIVIAGFLM